MREKEKYFIVHYEIITEEGRAKGLLNVTVKDLYLNQKCIEQSIIKSNSDKNITNVIITNIKELSRTQFEVWTA